MGRMLLQGKKGLVFGVANEHSLAWHIARSARARGHRVVMLFKPAHRGAVHCQVGDLALDASLTDYDEFVARTNATFAAMMGAPMVSADDVGQLIWAAVTDGADRLRYLIGDDARGFVKARRELSDQAYVDFMRSYFRK